MRLQHLIHPSARKTGEEKIIDPEFGVQIWCPHPQKVTKNGEFGGRRDKYADQKGNRQVYYLLGINRFSWGYSDFTENTIWEADVLPLNYSRPLESIT
jgi:hypothetical protein